MICKLFKKKVEKKEVRSDKKIQVAPTISVKLKQEIERLAKITDNPIKDIGEILCYEGVHDRDVIELLSPHFMQGHVRVDESFFYGCGQATSIEEIEQTGATGRVSIRFTQPNYADIKLLSNLFDSTPSRTVAVLLDSSIHNTRIIESIMKHHYHRKGMSDDVKRELKRFMRFVDRGNPYKKQTWNTVFKKIVHNELNNTLMLGRGRTMMTNEMIDKEGYKWTFE